MTTWAQEQATTREITRQTAGLVAAELGFTVDTNPDVAEHRGVYLDGPDGERLFVALDWRNADRVEISGTFPPNDVYGLTRPEIGVSRDRGPAVIAREITRRLLPGYREQLAQVAEANARRDAARTARNAAAARIRDITGGRSHDDTTRSTIHLPVLDDRGYGEVTLNHDGSKAEITLRSVPVEVAERLLRAFT